MKRIALNELFFQGMVGTQMNNVTWNRLERVNFWTEKYILFKIRMDFIVLGAVS